jgi:hypothetical protein
MKNPVELATRLSPDECVRRLRENVDSWWMLFGKKSVIGRISETRFTGRVRISYRNSFQTCVRADIHAEAGGTFIVCRFGMSRFVIAFMAVWFGGVGAGFCGVLLVLLHQGGHGADAWSGLGVMTVMLGFGAGLVLFCRWLARDEQAILTRFLCDLLQAHERPPTPL